MLSLLCFAALLFYFWYFYYSALEPLSEPTASSLSPPHPYRWRLEKKVHAHNTFEFYLNNHVVWEHALPKDTYIFNLRSRDVSRKNPCYVFASHGRVLATGPLLYDYVKHHTDTQQNLLKFQKTEHVQLEGNVYYFNCLHNKIESVGVCPSGHLFKGSRCVPIGPCTGQRNGKKLPDPYNSSSYIVCVNDQPNYETCPPGQFFYVDHCESKNNLAFYCKMESDPVAIQIDSTTLMGCLEGRVVPKRCGKGMRLFDTDRCEPDFCVGLADGMRFPMPEQVLEGFRFSPGYVTCLNNKVDQTFPCPQTWDPWQAEEEDLTFLPQVYHLGEMQCTMPSLCDNVYPVDANAIVPAYDFNKKVKNWQLSNLYDSTVGYVCVNGYKRRQVLPPGSVIKKFKIEDGCENNVLRLPIPDQTHAYYDCQLRTVEICPQQEYFNGEKCAPRPPYAFTHNNLPLFEFDSLNFESWIEPWHYVPLPPGTQRTCPDPEVLLSEYDVCAEPECAPYGFLTLIPAFSIRLPQTPFQCQFDTQTRRLIKEPTAAPHHQYWNQRVTEEPGPETCVPGQNLQTGHFVWDKTIYATCDPTLPFVFCPSVHTKQLVPVFSDYACDMNLPNTVEIHQPTSFDKNEARRVIPHPQHPNNRFQWKKQGAWAQLPDDGFEIPPNESVDLETLLPVHVNLRYRVTYPPDLYFEYDENDQLHRKNTSRGSGFMVRIEAPTKKPLTFPTYTPVSHVPNFL